MPEWTRRRVLLAALGIGAVGSGVLEHRRRRLQTAREADLTELLLNDPRYVDEAVSRAIEGDTTSTAEVKRIQASLRLQPPSVPYEREISRTLIQASRLATEQYLTGKFDLHFDGSIRGLPSYGERFSPYTQVASIRGPETVQGRRRIQLDPQSPQDPLLTGANILRETIRDLAGRALVIRWSFPVYWGFLLTGPDHHLLVLRGTQRGDEWLQTIQATQIDATALPPLRFAGSVHRGFATIYARLSRSVIAAVRQLDSSRPLYIAGHSLGSPLATLAALDIAQTLSAFRGNLRLYSYAGPRLGNPVFAEAFSHHIPNSYRVVNRADLVPKLPPTKTRDIIYVHLGEEWAFTTASGDIGPNHFISAYRDAIERGLEQPGG